MTNDRGESDISRRRVLQLGGLAAATIAGSTVLSGCQSGDSGLLVHGATGGSTSDTLDPHRPVTAADIARCCNLYEPLLFWDDDYKIAPAVAKSVEPSKDAKTWRVTLRDGVSFHNGKRVRPEDVLFTINRVANPKAPTSAGVALSEIIDFGKTKKLDSTSLQIGLKTPYAVLDFLLAEYTFGIIPADFDLSHPIGTGPFAYKSFTAGEISTFTTYRDYWGQVASIDRLQIQDFSDTNAQVNALLGNQIQTMDNLPYSLMESVRSRGHLLEAESGAWVPFTMRVDQKPFSDVRVRTAMRLICDRQQMIDQALSGKGQVGNDLYAPFDPSYAGKTFDQREQDIDQAKSLLRRAGYPDLQVQLYTGDDIGSVATSTAALFKQQAKKAGVDVRVLKKNPFYGADYLKYTFGQDFWNTRNYIPQAAVCALKNSTYNETHFDNAKFAQTLATAQATTDETKRNQLLQDCQQIEYDEGGYIVWGFRTQVDAYSGHVSGLKPSKYLPLGRYSFNRVTVS